MPEFVVENCKVDVTRSQITCEGNTLPIEPKVLQVLILLVENQGQVVSHESILHHVWPNVTVAPNSVQRCIGQLRKLFNDDAKSQRVITTHPKVGYQFVAAVKWTDESTTESSPSDKNKSYLNLVIIAGVICCLIMAGFYLFRPVTRELPITHLTPITTTDEKEYYPAFSPDGRYLVFNRYISLCDSQLWAKDLTNNQEFQLTKAVARYGPASWSPDGQQLAFSHASLCPQPKLDNCRSISTLSFALAKADAQTPRVILACQGNDHVAINWLSNTQLAFITQDENTNRVQTLSLVQNTVKNLYTHSTRSAVALFYSAKTEQLAITMHNHQQGTSLTFFDMTTHTAKHVDLKAPARFPDGYLWDPSWHPDGKHLIVSAQNSLFTLSLDGQFTEHPIATTADIYNPVYHPDGNSIAATLGIVDFDIGEYQWQTNPATKAKSQSFKILQRSTVADYHAQYQPNLGGLAFISRRTGHDQIWFVEQGRLKQLSHFTKDEIIDSYLWSTSGNVIGVAVNGQLQLISPLGERGENDKQQLISTPFTVVKVLQWLDQQRLLLSIKHNLQHKVVIFDINSGEYQSLHEGFTPWAQLADDGHLYYFDHQKQLLSRAGDTVLAIPNPQQSSELLNFYYKEGQLVLYYSDQTLWTYHRQDNIFTKLLSFEPTPRVFQLTDISVQKNRLLFETIPSASKELVMFQNDN